MRQVPRYLIIGNGRVSRHMQHYFTLLHIPFSSWSRSESKSLLQNLVREASHILVLIRDDAIQSFITKTLANVEAKCIHFSGSLVSQVAYGAHPLMTFSETLYSLEEYQSIPFVLDDDAPSFDELFPALPNAHVRLTKSLKQKYHALCVLSGNLSCFVWQKLFSSFENEFHFPKEMAHPYVIQTMKNILNNPMTALTGPLVRQDQETLANNIAALEGDFFKELYQSFISCYQKQAGLK